MTASADLRQRVQQLERRILREEQVLLGEISAIKRRHREQQAGSPRSHELEDVRRELRKIVRELSALDASGETPPPRVDGRRFCINHAGYSGLTSACPACKAGSALRPTPEEGERG